MYLTEVKAAKVKVTCYVSYEHLRNIHINKKRENHK